MKLATGKNKERFLSNMILRRSVAASEPCPELCETASEIDTSDFKSRKKHRRRKKQ